MVMYKPEPTVLFALLGQSPIFGTISQDYTLCFPESCPYFDAQDKNQASDSWDYHRELSLWQKMPCETYKNQTLAWLGVSKKPDSLRKFSWIYGVPFSSTEDCSRVIC